MSMLEELATRTDIGPREKVIKLFEADFAENMKRPEFRRFLMFICDDPTMCGIATDAGDNGDAPTTKAFFDLGRQRIGKLLFKRSADYTPDLHNRMTAETVKLRELLAAGAKR